MVRTYAQLYLDARDSLLEQESEEYATMAARTLVCHVCGKTAAQFVECQGQYATDGECVSVDSGVKRLLRQEPLAYILGEWSFYGLDLFVDEHVLIPRDDTCALAELAIKGSRLTEVNPRILDLCTGSGCVGLAIASRVKDARLTLGDISREALAVAKKNVIRHKLGGRVSCMQVDARRSAPEFLGKFHMIVSNPPYITTGEMTDLPDSVAKYEPHLALHGGNDGLDFYRDIVENFTNALRPEGLIAFEFGEGQGDAVCRILTDKGYTILERVRDFNNTERAVLAQYHREEE